MFIARKKIAAGFKQGISGTRIHWVIQVIIMGTENRQEEIGRATGKHIEMKTRWTGACEYELK